MVNKITWPKGWTDTIFYSFITVVIMLLISIRKIAAEDLLAANLIIIPWGIWAFYVKRWCINVYEDRITFTSMFKTKVYYFNEITIKPSPNTRIFDSFGNEVLRISDFLDNDKSVYKTYERYCKENNIRPKRIKKEEGIGYGNYIKNFYRGCFVLSVICVFLTILDMVLIFYYDEPYSGSDYMMLIVCIVISCLCLLLGIMFLLTYKNTKIRFEADKIIVKNLFGIEKEYYVEDCSVKEGKVVTTIYCNDKVIKRMFHYLSDDLVDVTARIKNRE